MTTAIAAGRRYPILVSKSFGILAEILERESSATEKVTARTLVRKPRYLLVV